MATTQLKFDDDLMGDAPELEPLSAEYEAFCQLVVATGNPSEAYRQAVATSVDTKPSTVWSESSRAMARPNVLARINVLRQEAARYAHITPGRIMHELGKIAFFDIRKLTDTKGNLKALKDMDDSTAAGISGIEFDVKKVSVKHDIYHDSDDEEDIGNVNETVTTTSVAKLKLADKTKALDSLTKIFGMNIDKHEVTGSNGTPLIPNTDDNEVARRVAFLLSQGLEAQ